MTMDIVSAQGTRVPPEATAKILETYFRAKDGNRPHLLDKVFTPDVRLEIINASAAISFPALTQGIEAVSEVLVRQFGRTYENAYSFYLSKPSEEVSQFKCAWLVGMTDKQSRDVRVGCGTYEWSLVHEPVPRANGLLISIDVMQVLAPAVQAQVMEWLGQLPYPWASVDAVLDSAPALNGLSPVLSALRQATPGLPRK